MSESKLSSVLPNNSIKGSMPRMPISTVYVENSNNKSSLEDISYVNDVTLGFSSKNFGSQNLFRFSRTYQFISQIVMELKIENPAVKLSDYFAYSAVDQIRFSVGGTELLSINGNNMLNIVLEQCETLEKKEALLNASGRREFSTTGATQHDIQTNTAISNGQDENYYYALIPCPWSSLSQMNKINPLPLHLLSEPVELQIIFKKGSEFCTGITEFSEANLHFRYGKLGNTEQLKSQVYRYPFHSHFSHEKNVASGGTSVDLQGFRKGEVEQLLFHFVPNIPTALGIDNDGVISKRFFDGIEVTNLKLKFNGQTIWQMPNKEHRIWNLIDGISSECRHNKRRWVIKSATANAVVAGLKASENIIVEGIAAKNVGIDGKATIISSNENLQGRFVYYRIPISEIRSELQKQGHYIGADFTKQSLQLTFDAPKSRNELEAKVPANVPTKLYITYTYRAMWQLDGESALLVY